MGSSELVFASRIVSVDYYMAEPVHGLDLEHSEFCKSDIKSVPVIRVFGSTPSGQTTCLHVHGVFSYLMIPYDGPDVVETHWSEIEGYMHVLAATLDNALNESGGKSKADRQHVFKIILLRGMPFYGYHAEEELFLKVYFYYPRDVKKAADILQNGMVLDRSFQVHEAHIPYILQYFLDYNLYGMNLLHAKNCWFRLPIGKPDPIHELPMIQRPDDVPSERKDPIEGTCGVAGKNKDCSENYLQAPTTSQFHDFDWNLLRAKGLSGNSPNVEQFEQEGDYINLSVEKSDGTTATQPSQNPRHTSRCLSCSDLCKSVISRTLTQDSTLINSPESTVHHSCPLHTLWTSEIVPPSAKLPIEVARHSTCDIEVDVLAADIANRYELTSQSTSNPGIKAIWEDERSRRRERDEDSQIPLDQSQPRVLPGNLSERESHFFQMLWDSLDRYKEENSIRSFSESPSLAASSSSMKTFSSFQSHHESNDLFASSGDTIINNDDIASSGGSRIPISSPIIISSGSSKTKDSDAMDDTCIDEDASTLEILRQLDERESQRSSVSMQRGNGPLDDDQEQLDSEGCLRSQNRKMRLLTQSLHISHSSQLIDSFSNTTQPLVVLSGDEDGIEDFEMSQRWDSAIQDLLNDMSATEFVDFAEDDFEEDDIPQLDGTSDDQPTNTTVMCGRRLTSAKRQYAVRSKQSNSDFIKNLINSTSAGAAENDSNQDSSTKTQVTQKTAELESRENIAGNTVNNCESNQCTDHVTTLPFDNHKSKIDTHFSTKHNLPLKNTSNKIFEKDEKSDKGSTGPSKETKSISSISEFQDDGKETAASNSAGKKHFLKDATSEAISVTLTKRHNDDRTSAFSRILDESPGVTLYDNTNLCKFTHTAVIDLDQMSETTDSNNYPISTLDGSLIKITSVPIDEQNDKSSKCCSDPPMTRKSRNRKKPVMATCTEVAKPTRTRRPRLAFKNSYLDDTLFETVFNSDFESDGEDARALTSKPTASTSKLSNGRKNKMKKGRDGRKKKERVVTKWIIVNRFKGISSMRVGLWRIPNLKRVKLTNELLRMYELYSPRNVNISAKPVGPPFIHPPKKPRPMGRRSKHMLASLCLFGPLSVGSDVPSKSAIESSKKNSDKSQSEASPSKDDNGTEQPTNSCQSIASQSKDGDVMSVSSSCENQQKMPGDEGSKSNDEDMEKKAVKMDSPILEKMAFDLMRIEHNLGEQCHKLRDNNTDVEHCKKDNSAFKDNCPIANERTTDVPFHGNNNKTAVVSLPVQDSVKNDGITMLSLKIACTTVVSAMKHDTASETEVGSLNATGSSFHSIDRCKGDCVLNNQTSQRIKAMVEKKEAGIETKVPDIRSSQQTFDMSSRSQAKGLCGESQTIQSEMKPCMLNVEGIAEHSVALKGLCINLGKDISREIASVGGKEKNRGKIGEADRSGKSGKLSSLKRADNEKSLKKKSLKSKKEAKKRKIDKTERDSKSTHDGDKGTKVSRSIVPVASRTVEPLCNRVSPILELEIDCDVTQCQSVNTEKVNCNNGETKIPSCYDDNSMKNSLVVESSKADASQIDVTNRVKKTAVKKIKHISTGKGQRSVTKVAVAAGIQSTVTTKCRITIQEKKTVTAVTSTRKIYAPSKKVTRNSVAVKLNSINPPTTMFTSISDDSFDEFPPLNALASIVFPPSPLKHPHIMHDPPRPWTPVKQKKSELTSQDNADNILEELAESFGADGTKVLDIVDESLFNNMNCFEELIANHSSQSGSTENQKEIGTEKPGAKDKNERMLEHFDKIFEDVTSCGSTKASASAAHSSCQFDEFEEETLMEFIDEMTSPTQLGNSNSSQMMSFPIPAPTPMEPNEAAFREKEAAISKHPLPQIHFPINQQADNDDPRPHSALPQTCHAGNVPLQKQFVNEKWSAAMSLDRPQSSFEGTSLPDVAQIQRSQSVMAHWNEDVSHQQNAVFNNTQMMKIHSNISSTNSMKYKSQNPCYGSQSKPDYFVDPRSSSKVTMNRPSFPYSFNQHYHDPATIPRPNSVMETPLQVFHTHVHHHHHVHSINNSNPGGVANNARDNFASVDNSNGHPFFQTALTDKAMDTTTNVKVEKITNPTWPQSMMPVQEQLHKPQRILEKNSQFCVSEPSFLLSKSGQQVCMPSTGLVQTLTYVNPTVPQNHMGNNSNFYHFAGLDPKAEGIIQSSIILPSQSQPHSNALSIILKGTCQLPQWQCQHTTNSMIKAKNSQRGKAVKRKLKSNIASCRTTMERTNFSTIATQAKTPYGIMKQNSLNNLKKPKDNTPKSIERKRKTISDFRAPPDTPTISLSGWTSVDTKNNATAFELSHDLFEAPISMKKAVNLIGSDESTHLVNLPKFVGECIERTSSDKLSHKSDVISESVSEPNHRPTPQIGEELILNSATGEWEVVPAEFQKSDDENKLCVTSPGKLPTLNDSLELFRKRNVSKFPDSSSDDDLCSMKKKKNLKASSATVPFSAPEYMVSSVDLKSNSPRLKLTLKKAPPSRGKPKFSTVPQSHTTSIKNQQDVTVQSEGSNPSLDNKLLNVVRTTTSEHENIESASCHQINDSDSTDDASETGSIVENTSIDLEANMKLVENRYVRKIRPPQIPFCTTMDEFYVATALTAFKDRISVAKENKALMKSFKKSLTAGKTKFPNHGMTDQRHDLDVAKSECTRQSEGDNCQNMLTKNSVGKITMVNVEEIKQLLNDCCNQVADSLSVPKFDATEAPLEATSGKQSHPGQDLGREKSQRDHKNDNKNHSANVNIPTASNRIRDDFDPPSPPENKQFLRKYSRPCFDDAKHFYITSNKPPTPSQVMYDLLQTGQASNLSSEEPFYGDKSDVQSTSNRLSTLPPYVKKPKPKKTISELSEHASLLPLEGGIQHWIVMVTAQKCYTAAENSVLREKASSILPENVRVWDHLDAASKMSQYPMLVKAFLSMSKDFILRPAKQPPTKGDVQNWLNEEKKKKMLKKSSAVESKSTEHKVESVHKTALMHMSEDALISPKSSLRRSSSFSSPTKMKAVCQPRRVSFELTPSSSNEEFRIIRRKRDFKSLKDSTSMNFVSKILRSTQSLTSPMQGPTSPFAAALSPVTPNTNDLNNKLVDKSNSKKASVTCDNNSSLAGSSKQEGTSVISRTPIAKTSDENSSPQQRDGSMKKQPQSTPNTSKPQHERAHKKLSYTPTTKRADDTSNAKAISPILAKSTTLKKSVLAKNFSKPPHDGMVTKKNIPAGTKEAAQSHPPPYASPPLSLDTPQSGKKEGSQIDGPTLDNTHGFKAQQQHLGDAKSLHITQHITVLSLELHVKTRIDLRPDPDMDEIRCLFYCLESDSWIGSEKGMRTGAIVVDPESVSTEKGEMTSPDAPCTSTASNMVRKDRELLKMSGITSLEVVYVRSEMELFLCFAQLMHQWDPDILVGYEVQMLSWGFLLQRAAHLRCDLCRAISRIPADEQRNKYQAVNDVYGADNASELHIVGRVVLNLWRLMRTELALYDYSFESIAFHMLHERHPAYDHKTLTNWFDPPMRSGLLNHCHRWRVVDYYVSRVQGNMRLLMQQDFIGRTSELARLFGIQFYEVLTRGSQFRVESMLLRTARAHNFVAVTPSILQRAQMRAPEVIALVMEPESKFYHVPVVVVDFQSLYPSMVIAYNICYSTCLGRVEHLGSDAIFTFGCTSLRVPAKTLNKLIRKNLISINPSGVAFVKPGVRRGVMPQMLDEILTTRIMVKNSMKKLRPEESATRRMLDHRQLGLKLIANVTYGYTAANFSGRMPCVEIGDSIVHKARETLERAIQLVTRNSGKWENARVVYGDTDSMFIALEGINNAGCSKARAFEVGKEICAAVTADNPTPVKLKFEKVYLPCILQTKKRYVGYAFESEDQKEPIFDAKGIETVRRDGTPATAKILEKMLKLLFDTRDVSQVKQYVLKQCGKLLDGRTTLQDCIIAKEYRGKQYYKPNAVVPALHLARKLLAMDKRAEPRVGERVPYVIVHGAPGTPLYQLVKSPLDVLRDPTLQLNGAYYVTKQVLPALDRMLSLLGVNVFLWHKFIPRTMHLSHNTTFNDSQVAMTKKATISQFFKSKHCFVCKNLSIRSICENCLDGDEAKQKTAVTLIMEAKSLERRKDHIDKICMQCTGAYSSSEIRCVSLDCSILYKAFRATYDSSKVKSLRKALQKDDLF